MTEDQRQQEIIAAHRLLVSEISAEIRSRRDPEHILTAALLGSVGAVAWGVAAVSTHDQTGSKIILLHPAIVGAIAVSMMAWFVLAKIRRENRLYRAMRAEQLKIVAAFASASGIEQEHLPSGLRLGAETNGNGVDFSARIIIAATIGIVLFCLSFLYWLRP